MINLSVLLLIFVLPDMHHRLGLRPRVVPSPCVQRVRQLSWLSTCLFQHCDDACGRWTFRRDRLVQHTSYTRTSDCSLCTAFVTTTSMTLRAVWQNNELSRIASSTRTHLPAAARSHLLLTWEATWAAGWGDISPNTWAPSICSYEF